MGIKADVELVTTFTQTGVLGNKFNPNYVTFLFFLNETHYTEDIKVFCPHVNLITPNEDHLPNVSFHFAPIAPVRL